MSGYLQRLVANAQSPNGAIRPLLGSVFSLSTSQAAGEGLREIAEVVVAPQRRTPLAPQPRGAVLPRPEPAPSAFHVPRFPSQPPTTEAGRPGADAEPIPNAEGTLDPEPRVTGRSSDAPPQTQRLEFEETSRHLAQSGREDQRTRREITNHDRFPTQPPTAEVSKPGADAEPNHDVPRRGEARLEAVREPAPLPRPYPAPLLESISRLDTEFIRPSAPLTASRMASSASHQNKARTRQEPDEIQIHIGRIEITALPPAPIRPAVAPVRKSLKLDEYLRRGRGSSS
jgi:hypothetical protein